MRNDALGVLWPGEAAVPKDLLLLRVQTRHQPRSMQRELCTVTRWDCSPSARQAPHSKAGQCHSIVCPTHGLEKNIL